jgi:quercetin dioxygenase-like cupin family protein
MTGALGDLPVDRPYPGVERRRLDGDGVTLVWYAFEPGAAFPVHRHRQEQVTVVEAGTVTMRSGPDDVRELGPGAYSVLPGGVEHGITAGPGGARIMIALVPRRAAGEQPEVLDDHDHEE